MKSRTVCACVIAMLLVSTVAFGEIVSDGDWDYGEYGLGEAGGNPVWSSTTASAQDADNYSWAFGEGWKYYYTTVEGTFDWKYKILVWTEAELELWDGQLCYAYASATAEADSPFGNDNLEAMVLVEDSGYEGYSPYDTNNGGFDFGITESGTDDFEILEGVSSEHVAVVVAFVPQYSEWTITVDDGSSARPAK